MIIYLLKAFSNAIVRAILQHLIAAAEARYAATEISLVIHNELECGPMPNVMAALPNIGGALCSTPQSLADAHY